MRPPGRITVQKTVKLQFRTIFSVFESTRFLPIFRQFLNLDRYYFLPSGQLKIDINKRFLEVEAIVFCPTEPDFQYLAKLLVFSRLISKLPVLGVLVNRFRLNQAKTITDHNLIGYSNTIPVDDQKGCQITQINIFGCVCATEMLNS